jgi:hypothetical protein
MNPNTLTKQYGFISPEERFRLIMAASSRRDEVERDRLAKSGTRMTVSIQDHAPFALAFSEVGTMMYIDLVEDASMYLSSYMDRGETEFSDDDEPTEEEMAAWEKDFRFRLAEGYLLKAKADGWKLFCERLNVPPFVIWEHLPGFERLQISLRLAEKAAFVPEGFLCWLNEGLPAGCPEMTVIPYTAQKAANELEEMFRERVGWWRP